MRSARGDTLRRPVTAVSNADPSAVSYRRSRSASARTTTRSGNAPRNCQRNATSWRVAPLVVFPESRAVEMCTGPFSGESARPVPSATDTTVRETERWFIRQGLPHFIADYTATGGILPRTIPVLTLAFLVTVSATVNRTWPLRWNVGAGLATFLVLVAVWAAVNRARGLPALRVPERVAAPTKRPRDPSGPRSDSRQARHVRSARVGRPVYSPFHRDRANRLGGSTAASTTAGALDPM